MVKGILGALIGSVIGFAIWFGFTAITHIWTSLLGALVGAGVAWGIVLIAKSEIHTHRISFKVIAFLLSIITVALSEYEINRFMYGRSGDIDLSQYPVIPSDFSMYLEIVYSSVWWQPIFGALLAGVVSLFILKDSVD